MHVLHRTAERLHLAQEAVDSRGKARVAVVGAWQGEHGGEEVRRRPQAAFEQTDLAQVLQQSITNAESKVPRRDVEIVFDVPDGLPQVDGDASQLCQVFSNLLTNAFEAVNGKGRVVLRASLENIEQDPAFGSDAPEPAVVVDVIDDGPGIPAELSDRIFNPFFTTKTTGSGLGLPIVRKIVDAHDGRLDLSSGPAKGTRFRVTLPVSSKSSWFK